MAYSPPAAIDPTPAAFPFRAEANIQREIWKKAIVNTVFNSICPLLEVDNGTFARDERSAELAREVVGECTQLTERLGLDLGEEELMAQILRISEASPGQLISTLQDIRAGRPTEIAFLNLAIARASAVEQDGILFYCAWAGRRVVGPAAIYKMALHLLKLLQQGACLFGVGGVDGLKNRWSGRWRCRARRFWGR